MFDARLISHHFGEAASRYDAQAYLQQRVRETCTMLAERHWPEGSSVLDLGCGTGALHSETKKLGWRITGLDLAPGMCSVARERGAVAIHGEASAMPFADDAFDGVFSSLMLQWACDLAAVFGEIARVLKPGGHAVLATLADGTLKELQAAFTEIDDTTHVSRFLKSHDILKSAEEAGLAMVSARQAALVEHYPDVISLMRSLQAIGATNAEAGRRKGLMTPRQCARLEQAYASRFRQQQGLPASWQTVYMVVRKG